MNARVLSAFAVISLALFYIGDRFGDIAITKRDALAGVNAGMDGVFASIGAKPLYLSFEPVALLWGFALFAAAWIVWCYFFAMQGNYRNGEEHGSSRWGTVNEGRAFLNKKEPDNNLIFTEKYGMALKRKRFNLKVDRNLNVLVVGGSGSGKTRYYVKPNLLQLNSSYFLTDPKGTALEECGYLLADSNYNIRVFDTIHFEGYYNPLRYVKTDAQILSFVHCLIANTNGDKKANSDPFWENSEILLYVSLISLLRDWFDPRDYSLSGLLTLLSMAEAKEDDEDFLSPLDLLFMQVEKGKVYVPKSEGDSAADAAASLAVGEGREFRPATVETDFHWVDSGFRHNKTGVEPAKRGGLSATEDFALGNYKAFKTAAGKTLKSIIISCNVRLKPLSITEVNKMIAGVPDEDGDPTGECAMSLDTLGDPNQRSAVFAIMSDTDKTFSFLHAIMMWQTINLLCERALVSYHGKLPTPVHFIFDEFANIGTVPSMEQTIAVTRSRNIFISIILQSLSQLESRYDKDAKTIIDCCDTTLFLGGKSTDTNKEIAETIGKQTINTVTLNESKGQQNSYTKNYQTGARDLLDAAEVGRLERDKAIVLIAGAPPLMDLKYRLDRHKRYSKIDPGHEPVAGKWPWSKPECAEYGEPFDYKAYSHNKRNKDNGDNA